MQLSGRSCICGVFKGIQSRLPGKIDALILLCNGAAGHFQGIQFLALSRSALRVIVQKRTGTQGEVWEVGFLNGGSQVSICVILIVCLSHYKTFFQVDFVTVTV